MSLAAVSQVVIPVSLQYSNIITKKNNQTDFTYISFNNASNLLKFGALPVYYYEIKLPAKQFGCEIKIDELSSNTLTAGQSYNLTDNELAGDSFKKIIKYSETTAQIYILPLKWDSKHRKIILLNKFNLLIDFVPVAEKNKTSLKVVHNYATESVLSTGKWIKMGIAATGVYKLTYTDIENMGINPSQIDINKIGIFGNYNGVLPESNFKPVIDDLQENSIYISGIQDGTFDTSDYILFYGQAATTWSYNPFKGKFVHQNNIYSDTTYYFFTPDEGTSKPIAELIGVGLQANKQVTTFSDYAVHEYDYENLMKSGREWFGERFNGDTLVREFTFNFPNIVNKSSIYLNIDLAGRSLTDSYYRIIVNNTLISDSTKIRFITPSLGLYARVSNKNLTFSADDDVQKVKVSYFSEDENAMAWLNYITLNVERNLVFDGGQMRFCNPHVSASGNISQFDVKNANSNSIVWDITDIHNPQTVTYSVETNKIRFTLPTDSLKTFVIFDNSQYFTPVSYKDVKNQNLHQISDANLIIIRPHMFEAEADKLADMHRQYDALTTVCVSPEQIYNEFSSGSQDISGIRNFMKMLYNKGAFGNKRAYLLLFGDASFDYKFRTRDNTNIVPTYESVESLRETGSFVTDDYFGLLDDNEGASASGNLDIGIGRFPINTIEEANSAINKITHYISSTKSIMRDWRTKLCFVADDQDLNLHFKQAEGLVKIADTVNNGIAINKVYLDAFQVTTVPDGYRYPEVNTIIKKQIDDGALIVNYTGHGGVLGWSGEKVLDVPMINGFHNIDNMPLIITATCEFSRFDDAEFTSAGEYFFLNEKGGAIALLTTTRLAYAHANYIVNRRIYFNLLTDEDGNRSRLGDLVRLSKIPSNDNYLNFVLLGDPALTLAYPKYNIVTTNNLSSTLNVMDTVHALSIVNVTGEIQNDQKQLVSNFNGYVFPKVIDKATLYTTLGNNGSSSPANFYLYDKKLFDGKIKVVNGKFEFNFAVPQDIAYNYGYGKISYYATDTVNAVDAWGGFNDMYIGGIDDDAVIDDVGPDIELYLNKNSFKSGDVVTNSPVLLAHINDENGVNSTGVGLGRDIVMYIDNDYSNSFIMNDFFSMDVDSYKSGKIVYPFNKLSEGNHTLTLKAWDLQNNSSEKTIEFFVNDKLDIQLSQVYNYPNPFDGKTIFKFTHNKDGSELQATIRIYNASGNFVIELHGNTSKDLNKPGEITWDGKNTVGNVVASGLYVYTIEVKDNFGNVTVQQQKLFKINK